MRKETQALIDLLKGSSETNYLETNPVDLAIELECSVTEIYSAIRFLVKIEKVNAISDDFGLVGLYLK